MVSKIDISYTPMAPYVGVIDGMSQKDKLAVVAYLINALQGGVTENDNGHKKRYKRESEFTEEDRNFLHEKIKSLKTSPSISRLSTLQHEAASYIDTNDERTRYMIGLEG